MKLLFLILAFLASPASAQIPVASEIISPVTQAETQYRQSFDIYRANHNTYQTAKSNWKTNPTLKAGQEALIAAQQVARSRNQALLLYIDWLQLQLKSFTPPYDKAVNIAEKLNNTVNQINSHQQVINNATSVEEFNAAMEEYASTQLQRDKIFAIAQIELKLAHFTDFQHQSRSLYEPVLENLKTKQNVPEVQTGISRITMLGDQINVLITDTSNLTGKIEASRSFNNNFVFRDANKNLSSIHAIQQNLLEIMLELESRYARN